MSREPDGVAEVASTVSPRPARLLAMAMFVFVADTPRMNV